MICMAGNKAKLDLINVKVGRVCSTFCGLTKYGNRCLSSPEQKLIEKLLLKITRIGYLVNVQPRTKVQQNYHCR